MAVPIEDTVPSYSVARPDTPLTDTVTGRLRITEAGALMFYTVEPGLAAPGQRTHDVLVKAYAPGRWMSVERLEPKVRRDPLHTVRRSCQCVHECCADLPAHYHGPDGHAVPYGPGNPPPEDL